MCIHRISYMHFVDAYDARYCMYMDRDVYNEYD